MLAWQLVVAATHTGVFLAVTLKGEKKNPTPQGHKAGGQAHTYIYTEAHTYAHTLLAGKLPSR